MDQKYWNFLVALGILVTFLVLGIVAVITRDSFVTVFFIVLAGLAGTAVSLKAEEFLGSKRFPKLPPELILIVIFFAIAIVAVIYGLLDEAQFLEASLAILAYTLGRS